MSVTVPTMTMAPRMAPTIAAPEVESGGTLDPIQSAAPVDAPTSPSSVCWGLNPLIAEIPDMCGRTLLFASMEELANMPATTFAQM